MKFLVRVESINTVEVEAKDMAEARELVTQNGGDQFDSVNYEEAVTDVSYEDGSK